MRLVSEPAAAPTPADLPRPADPDALLPNWARRPAAVIAGCCAVIVLVLAVLVAHTSGPDALDRAVDSWLRARLGGHQRLLTLLMDPGEPVQSIILTAVVAAACLAARRIEGAALTVVSALLASGIAELILKPIVHRTLGTFVVYPSGHTCRAFMLAAVIVVLMISAPRRPVRTGVAVAVGAILFLAGCAVGVAVICLNFHYFTDTVGGAALGVCVVIGTAFVLDLPGIRARLTSSRLTTSRRIGGRPA
jgi:membrane-associated phospholipid phosphatase